MPDSYFCYACNHAVHAVQQEDGNYLCTECHGPFVEIREEPVSTSQTTNNSNNSEVIRLEGRNVQVTHFPNGVTQYNILGTDNATTPRMSSNFLNLLLGQVLNLPRGFNPGDFFSGDMEGLLNQLMQADRHMGPPKTSRDFIRNIVHRHPTPVELQSMPVCAVCEGDIGSEDTIICLPCKHLYHDECILPWISQHNTCPVCRAELPVSNSDDENDE